ncbi:hypothetical protein BLNAU_20510 [Blattamonas nauphoetae]|uniref:Uncharacterized protein n=1 Tax=Blattamonas nauphoetae TaxID=2049346 RepID=A0ABQ9WYG1_9EUKA|nr:hypothetical protein BLNAU_20510 [Blattamonas nauphoetae]
MDKLRILSTNRTFSDLSLDLPFLPSLNLSAVIARHLAPISPNTSIRLLIPLVLNYHLPDLPEIIGGISNESVNNLFQIIKKLSTTVNIDRFQEKQTITTQIKGICDSFFELEPTDTFTESNLFEIPFFSSFTFVCFIVDPDVFSAILHVFNCQTNHRDGIAQTYLLTLPGTTLPQSIDLLLRLFMTPSIYNNTPMIAKSIVLLKSVLPPDFRIAKQSAFSRDAVKPLFDRLTSKEETRPAADAFLHLITIPVTITFCPIVSTPRHVLDPQTLKRLNDHLQFVCDTLSEFLSSPRENANLPKSMIIKLTQNKTDILSVKSLLLVEGTCWMDCLRAINTSFLTPLNPDIQTLLRIFSFTEQGWTSPDHFRPPKRQSPAPLPSTLHPPPPTPPICQSTPPPTPHRDMKQQTPKPKSKQVQEKQPPSHSHSQPTPDSKQESKKRNFAVFKATRPRTESE